ncbi:MAG: acyl-CoA/acyl-ACP dehydrogenase [Actinobacteria bacterium]|nr:acyl-CoA/acyl-ACP dehydrogenase [Actinomycetota bacterium]
MPGGLDLAPPLHELRALAAEVAASTVAPRAETVDRDAVWPAESMRALGEAGLLGLHVDPELGGRGEGMLALALVTEELGRVCGSTGLVYGMHCVGSKVVAAKATPDQRERYLAPIAAGRHVTSLGLSEPGTGIHFYLPRTTFRSEDDHLVLNGRKSFVTSGGHADSYVLSVVREDRDLDPGTFSCVLLDALAPGTEWSATWDGLGMRGNSSRGLDLVDAPVPVTNLLGSEGDETWYVFEIVAPYFIVAMSGTYLGIARSALEVAIEHLRERTYTHTTGPLGTYDTVAHRLGELWGTVERTRQLLHHAARLGDAGDPASRPALFAAKAEVADAVVRVTNDAMTLVGGLGFARDGVMGRALRDARASHVMSPTTDLLKTWLGRTLLDLPLL